MAKELSILGRVEGIPYSLMDSLDIKVRISKVEKSCGVIGELSWWEDFCSIFLQMKCGKILELQLSFSLFESFIICYFCGVSCGCKVHGILVNDMEG